MDTVLENNLPDTASSRPVIEITSCPAATANQKMVIAGNINSDAKDLHMFVNGQEYKIMNGKFLISLPLEAGNNDFNLILKDGLGNIFREKRSIFCGKLPPVVEMDEVPDVTAADRQLLTGRLENPNQLKEKIILTVNGTPVTVASDGRWKHYFDLAKGRNLIEVTARDTVLQKTVINKEINCHPNAPEIFLEGLFEEVSSHYFSFCGKMKNFDENRMNILIHNKVVPVTENTFSYHASIRTETVKIPFAVELDGRVILKFSRTVAFAPSPPTVEVEEELKRISPTHYRIFGIIQDENDSDPALTVNGWEVLPKNGKWTAVVELKAGVNVVLVEGKNNAGKKTTVRKLVFVRVDEDNDDDDDD